VHNDRNAVLPRCGRKWKSRVAARLFHCPRPRGTGHLGPRTE